MDGKITPENFAVLAKVTIKLCDMVIMCAPPFAPGSSGAQTVAIAQDIRPRLVGMIRGFDRDAKSEEKQ